ncbi:DUF3099 domain-containing protein [Streptomyces sp. NP160]|uniref:DUF3099 domain-containing protein n=1 Tax=Streptomyces sp. NP160 TaxID=2586637 RepID=UPI001C55CC74|nr:DUF3099 domain-containing protein [Streptomyces sp. NP160]
MARTQTPRPDRRSSSTTPSITSVGRSHQDDINSRMLKYSITMGIRVLCFGLIFVLPSPWRWVAAVGAIFLPYVAVLIANAGRERLPVAWGSGRSVRDVPSPHREEPAAEPAALRPVQVVRGETVDRGAEPAPGRAAEQPAARSADRVVPPAARTDGATARDDDEPPQARAS